MYLLQRVFSAPRQAHDKECVDGALLQGACERQQRRDLAGPPHLKGDRAGAMGSVMALMTAAHSMGMLAGAVSAGLMMDIFQLRAAFPCGAALMLGGMIGFFLLVHESPDPKTPRAYATIHNGS